MSLISQNAASKNRVKATRDEADEPMINDDNGAGNVEEAELDVSRSKKRRKEKEKEMEIEEEREMNKLENFLFGSLQSPVEFGKEDEKAEDNVEGGSALFYVDHSTDGLLSTHNEVAESADEDKDQKVKKQREAVWVDEEEEQTNIDIAKINRLRKLRKEEDESLISGKEYVSRLRAQHVKLNPGTEWAQPDSHLRKDGAFDDSSDEEDGVVIAPDYENAEGVDDILRTNEELVVKSSN